MTKAPVLRIFSLAAALLCLPMLASAATLQAKVVQVDSGNTLVVSNINRPLRIRLKGIVPPEPGQAFSEAAREHLKALLLDKTVVVMYTHLADGYLEAKVILDGIDIGSQMLRDGVAWYDRASNFVLSESDRDLYAKCEQAARHEKRGLWQDSTAVAPWEFRRIQQDKLNAIVSQPSFRQSQSRARAKQTGLSNDDLLGAMASPGSIAGQPNLKSISANGSPGRWTRYESVTERFSVLIPSNAVEGTYTAPGADGNPAEFHYLGAGDDRAFYVLLSAKGPNGKSTDAAAAEEAFRGFIGGMNRGIAKAGASALVTSKAVRELRVDGYSGKQYTLSADNSFSGVVRVLTKQVGDQRQLFLLFVMTRPGSESLADQFLNSFKITAN